MLEDQGWTVTPFDAFSEGATDGALKHSEDVGLWGEGVDYLERYDLLVLPYRALFEHVLARLYHKFGRKGGRGG